MSSTDSQPQKQLSFGVWRGRWLDQVNDDLGLKPLTCRIAYMIMRHVNDKTRATFAGDYTLAKKSGCSERAVQSARAELERFGHITQSRPAGREIFITPVLKAPEHFCGDKDTGKPFRAPPAESTGCARNSLDSHDSQKKKESKEARDSVVDDNAADEIKLARQQARDRKQAEADELMATRQEARERREDEAAWEESHRRLREQTFARVREMEGDFGRTDGLVQAAINSAGYDEIERMVNDAWECHPDHDLRSDLGRVVQGMD